MYLSHGDLLRETQVAESPEQHLRNRALDLITNSCPGRIIPGFRACPEYGLLGKEVENTFGCSLRVRLVLYSLIYLRWFTPLQGLPTIGVSLEGCQGLLFAWEGSTMRTVCHRIGAESNFYAYRFVEFYYDMDSPQYLPIGGY